MAEFVEHGKQVLQAAAEAVESPDGHEVELPASGGVHQAVERRSRCRRPTHAIIDVLSDDVPSPLAGDLAEFVELQANVLAVAGGAHAGVERRA